MLRAVFSYCVFITLILTILISGLPVRAQSITWFTPLKLYQTSQNAIEYPSLIVDRQNRVHVFWNERVTNPDGTRTWVIHYTGKEQNKWSPPVDIISHPNHQMDFIVGCVDPFGRLHLVFGGTDMELTYIRTKGTKANDPKEWIKPKILSESVQAGGSIGIDQQNRIHVIYGTLQGAIYYRNSADWGNTWSPPRVIAEANSSGLSVDAGGPKLSIAKDGSFHIAYTLVPSQQGYPPTFSYYISSPDEGKSWSQPKLIAPRTIGVASIQTRGESEVHILLTGMAGVGGRYHTYSTDLGKTWSSLIQITAPRDGSGLSGGSMVVDSAGVLHAIIGLKTDTVIAHTQWKTGQWDKWQPIKEDETAIFERMFAGITQGNLIHVVWENTHNEIWYAMGMLPAPEVPSILPTPLISVDPSKVFTSTPSFVLPSATPIRLNNIQDEPSQSISFGNPLLISLLISVMFVCLVGLIYFIRR